MNWVAPSTTPASVMEHQTKLIAQKVLSNDKNIGLVLMPMFTYKQGHLWLVEHQTCKSLVQRGLHIDKQFGLVFEKKADKREARPLLYNGRFLLDSAAKLAENLWRYSPLFVNGRTHEAKQLSGNSMTSVEDIDPGALPMSVDDANVTVQGANKFQQLGVDACEKLLTGMLDNLASTDRHALVIMDLNPDVGDVFAAVQKIRPSYQSLTLHYVATCYTQVHQEWFEHTWINNLARQFENKELVVPGFQPKSYSPPSNLLDEPPPRPPLNLMTWLPDVEETPGRPRGVAVPQTLLAQWYQHPQFGQAFRDFVDTVVMACGSPDGPASNTPLKRKKDGEQEPESDKKHLKVSTGSRSTRDHKQKRIANFTPSILNSSILFSLDF